MRYTKYYKKITGIRDALNAEVEGQERAVDVILLTALSRGTALLTGPSGESKTDLVRRFGELANLKVFYVQGSEESAIEEVIGTLSPKKLMEEDRISHIATEFFESDIAVFDEINRVSGPYKNSLLEIIRKREYNGRSIPLKMAFMMMNPPEYADTHELGEAFGDRILYAVDVPGLVDSLDVTALTRIGLNKIQARKGKQVRKQPVMSQKEWSNIWNAVDNIVIPDYMAFVMANTFVSLRRNAREHISTRSLVNTIEHAMAANAFLNGRDVVGPHDLEVLYHIMKERTPSLYATDGKKPPIKEIIEKGISWARDNKSDMIAMINLTMREIHNITDAQGIKDALGEIDNRNIPQPLKELIENKIKDFIEQRGLNEPTPSNYRTLEEAGLLNESGIKTEISHTISLSMGDVEIEVKKKRFSSALRMNREGGEQTRMTYDITSPDATDNECRRFHVFIKELRESYRKKIDKFFS